MLQRSPFLLLMLAVLLPPGVLAKDPVKLGERVGQLRFKDIHYLPRSLDDCKDKKAFVLVFTTTTCPLVQRYLPVLRDMEKEYRAKGVQFLAVNVGGDDSIAAMATQAVRHEMEFPFVKDTDLTCAGKVGVTRTPEVALLDGERRLRYRGRIDDQYRLSGVRATATRHDLKAALDAVLAGKDVDITETPVDGCPITAVPTRTPKTPVTFAEHVAPLLRKHCQSCHRPGASAPFALTSYRDVASKAATIAEAVADQRMPPWFASPDHGPFVNCRTLSAEERDLLLHWLRSDMPPGDDAKLPAPLPLIDKWAIGQPDLVLTSGTHELPEAGDIPYRYAMIPHVFTDDTWVQAVQILPDNPRVMHHCNMAFVKIGERFSEDNLLTGNVPGGEILRLEDGLALCIPKGAVLGLQIHYVATGKPEKCTISVGFKFAKVVHKRLRHAVMVNKRFAIPPGAPAERVAASKVLTDDAVGVGMFTHMHLRGRDMTFLAHFPDGKSETLLIIPNYNFSWQMPYRWEPGTKRLPKGTRLECVAHYDNSAFNPFNPDASATVRVGSQTYQEMMYGFVFYVQEAERLNLTIDPKTGRVQAKDQESPSQR